MLTLTRTESREMEEDLREPQHGSVAVLSPLEAGETLPAAEKLTTEETQTVQALLTVGNRSTEAPIPSYGNGRRRTVGKYLLAFYGLSGPPMSQRDRMAFEAKVEPTGHATATHIYRAFFTSGRRRRRRTKTSPGQ